MALLKRELSKEDFDKLDEKEKIFYPHKNEDGTLGLDVEGYVDTSALVNAKNRQTERANKLAIENKAYEDKIKQIEADKQKAIDDANNKSKGTEDEVTKKFQKQIDDLKSTFEAKEIANRFKVEKALVEKNATEIAQLFKSKKAGEAVAKSRIKVEHVNGEPVTIFLDDFGNKTDMNFEQFKENILADADLKNILNPIQSTGGNANGANQGGNATKQIKDMTPGEQVDFANKNPQTYLDYLNKQSKY